MLPKIWHAIGAWWNISFKHDLAAHNLVSLLTLKDIKPIFRVNWMIVVALIWWNIWKARNSVIFQGSQVDISSIIIMIKRESLFIGSSHYWLSNNLANLWNIDPNAALEYSSKSKKRSFLLDLFKNYSLVGFSDGAWKSAENKGGMGGVILEKASVMIFSCSGPIFTTSAMGAELEACKYMWQTMGEFESVKSIALCLDSKNIVC